MRISDNEPIGQPSSAARSLCHGDEAAADALRARVALKDREWKLLSRAAAFAPVSALPQMPGAADQQILHQAKRIKELETSVSEFRQEVAAAIQAVIDKLGGRGGHAE